MKTSIISIPAVQREAKSWPVGPKISNPLHCSCKRLYLVEAAGWCRDALHTKTQHGGELCNTVNLSTNIRTSPVHCRLARCALVVPFVSHVFLGSKQHHHARYAYLSF